MMEEVSITSEVQYRSSWIKIFIPEKWATSSFAIIKNIKGDVLKKVFLNEGNNAIDVSTLNEGMLSVKVETPFETILKHVKLNQ